MLKNRPEELKEYADYISSIETLGGTIAVVDTFTYRFSSLALISKSVKNPVIGLYWRLSQSAREIALEEKISYASFMKDFDTLVPCWNLIEFILSAPEMPIVSIKNCKPQYNTENENEKNRADIFSLLLTGVELYLKDGDKNKYYANYQAVQCLLSKFYNYPTQEDINNFSVVSFSSLPDHSDTQHLVGRQLSATEKAVSRIKNNRFVRLCTYLRRQWLERKRYQGDVSRLVQVLLKYDIVSFDIFDTLIYRDCPQPSSVFEMLENENGLYDFKNTRIRAEQDAQWLYPERNNEPSIYDIYNVLKHYYGDEVQGNVEREIELELEVCNPNPYMLEVFNLIKEQKKQIILVSDMYLTKQQIERILQKCNVCEYADIFISSEYTHSKKTGMLYDDVRQRYGDGLKYIHIGDNVHADYIMAKKKGWNAILI